MKNITRVQICNFQNHKDTDITLHEGVNLIVGSSEHGKSALLRAIAWVLFNMPKGVDFIKRRTSEASVTLHFSDGTVVTRIRSEKRNAVQVTKPDGTELAFEKIGTSLPIEVVEAMGNPPMDERHGPISYARQLDPLFLTSLTATELPRSISELTGIDDFEEAVSILSKQSTASKKAIKEAQERIAGYDTDLEKYADLDDKLNELIGLESDSAIIDKQFDKLTTMDTLLSKYQVVINTGRIASRKMKRTKAIATFDSDLASANNIKNTIVGIGKVLLSYSNMISNEQIYKQKINQCNILGDDKMTRGLSEAKKIQQNIVSVSKLITDHAAVMVKGKSIKTKWDTWTSLGKDLLSEQTDLITYMKDNGFWCDVCNRPLTSQHKCEDDN